MAADSRMGPQRGVWATAGAGDHVDVDVVVREGLGMVLHAGTAPEIAEDDRGHAHGIPRSQQEPTTGLAATPAGGVSRRILIAVGPTAGHVYPALAVADAYRARCLGSDVRFAGPAVPLAARLLAASGYTLQSVRASQLVNVGPAGKIAGAARVVAGFLQARHGLRARPPRLAIGLGGYASGAVLLAARSLGARVAIHEANVQPGLANRLLAPLAHRIYVGNLPVAPAFQRRDVVVTGHPVRASIAALAAEARPAPPPDRPARVLVLNSTRGERFFAERVPALLAAVVRRGVAVEALHQSGRLEAAGVAAAYRAAGVKATVVPYLDEIAGHYRWADVVLARSGAGTIAEVAAAGLPSVLVPLPDASGDHQAGNAFAVAATGAAIVVRESAWQRDAMAAQLATLLGQSAVWVEAAAAARRLARPDAADRIVEDCETLMTGRW
jgi:UDP-N-acetylglucosamine--N-acetylmuramyl-(pentapeptide) pyrophosphoryl-undecaprenol N-acetylglucosamine transferase